MTNSWSLMTNFPGTSPAGGSGWGTDAVRPQHPARSPSCPGLWGVGSTPRRGALQLHSPHGCPGVLLSRCGRPRNGFLHTASPNGTGSHLPSCFLSPARPRAGRSRRPEGPGRRPPSPDKRGRPANVPRSQPAFWAGLPGGSADFAFCELRVLGASPGLASSLERRGYSQGRSKD